MLEEGSFRRVGGLKDIPLDVRVVVASNRDLQAESAVGRFRPDLYYRLSVIQPWPAATEVKIISVVEPMVTMMTETWVLPDNYWDGAEAALSMIERER